MVIKMYNSIETGLLQLRICSSTSSQLLEAQMIDMEAMDRKRKLLKASQDTRATSEVMQDED
ncbi:hypothetical protein JYU34_005972 [Plutella xylostella]|uniref:Uncharacterized protein n=1 Tax=Plutella xylostella TaxID=51655 RepID=A0ABQ7QUL2_PLUXY|nr:hypothetical protein JYU34_005972 [Plutella xylostella]